MISEVYEEILPKLTAYLTNRIKDAEISRDLAQDIFVRLMEYDNLILQKKAMIALAFRMAQFAVFDWLRHSYTVVEAHAEISARGETLAESADSNCMAIEIMRLEAEAVRGLQGAQKEAYLLRRFGGCGHEEIAQRLGITRRGSESCFLRALTKVRDHVRACI